MPFAGFDSFEACTREHNDKQDPEAYCAEIHYQATGEYPNQKSVDEVYDDPNLCVKYALEAMKGIGKRPTEERMAAISTKAQTLLKEGDR